MTTKTITGAYPNGYTLSAAYDRLVATSSASLGETGGYGVRSTHLATFDNYGKVTGTGTGVGLTVGGTVVNQAGGTISGAYGVEIFGGVGLVENYGKISGRTELQSGGAVINGSAGDTKATIAGVVIGGTLGAVTNFGQCGSVNLEAGGTVTNGLAGDLTAKMNVVSIYGGSPGAITNIGIPGTVTNFGTVTSVAFNDHNADVNTNTFTNGSAQDTAALCEGTYAAVIGRYCGVTIVNFGTIADTTTSYNTGNVINVRDSIDLTNGSATDTGALVSGYEGISYNFGPRGVRSGTVVNFGTIVATGTRKNAVGVFVLNGTVTNGSAADTVALVSGYVGIKSAAAVVNYGTIIGTGGTKVQGYDAGVLAGVVTNGSMADRTALIEGYYGVNGGVIANYGAIVGTGQSGVYGGLVKLANGAVGDSSALIEGGKGVYADGGTVTNFGTIEGTAGVALQFRFPGQGVLQVEAGSTFIGAVLGYGGTLDFASGNGTLAGLFTPAGTIVAYGAIARTTFTGFGTLEIGAGASFSVAGYGTVKAGGEALIVAGTLTTSNTIGSAGAITVSGILAGSGTLRLSGGSATIGAGGALTIANIAISGGATAVAVDTSLTYTGTLKQTNGTLSVGAGDILTLTGADTLAGTLAGGGSVTVKNTLTIGASEVLSGVTLTMSNASTPVVVGAGASSRLVNTSGVIQGAGQLGGGVLTLVNKAGGVINGNVANALVINTGATAIYNAGLIKASGAGGVRIASAITNYGTLQAQASTLTVQGVVTGSGGVRIAAGGVVDFASSFTENVTFAAPTGTLELAQSQAYAGTITGFSKTGGTSLDLADIGFTSGVTKASYSGTTASGTLTVTDGSHTAQIKLTGNYTASTFTVSSDGHGGTTVVDPAAGAAPLAQAMAGFQHGPPAHLAATAAYSLPRFPTFHAQA